METWKIDDPWLDIDILFDAYKNLLKISLVPSRIYLEESDGLYESR